VCSLDGADGGRSFSRAAEPYHAKVNLARLIFYAIASFFLGAIALASGSAATIEVALGIQTGPAFVGDAFPNGEPLRTIMVAVTVVAPVFFLALAVVEVIRPSDRP
jgi:hypothetical protein